MKKDLTEMVFILDRSGSMSGLENDTIGGFNSLIESQKKEEGEALVSTILFNSISEVIHDRVDIKEVKKLDRITYQVGGSTALIDALGGAIDHISMVHRYIRKEDVPDKTIFVITTDGYENASHKYSAKEVKRMIEIKKRIGWEFLFLGANIDAIETAKEYGIDASRAATYYQDAEGIDKNYKAMNRAIHSFRVANSIDESWNAEVEEYHKKKTK